jgi:NADH:ubiquinone reductase (non-electrogenic)
VADKKSRVVIVGGGFGGLFTALDLAGVADVTLVSDLDHFLFAPMLYEYLSGEVEAWHIAPAFKELLDERVEVVTGLVTNIDLKQRVVVIQSRTESLPYDVLLLAVGGVSNYWNIEGAAEHSLQFRKLADADALRRRMVDALDRVPPDLPEEDVRRALTFAIVGAGASGVELSTKMGDLLLDAFKRRSLKGQPRVMVVEMGDRILPGMGAKLRDYVQEALRKSSVEVHTETRVLRVTPTGFTYEHAGKATDVSAAGVVWTAGVRPSPLVENLEVEKDKRGLIKIKPTLQTASHDEVFALGDITDYPDASPHLAGTAQIAFQEAKLAAANVRALLNGDQLKSRHFEELGEALSLGTGDAALIAEGVSFHGPLARRARFAMYTARLPTWHHRLRVGASWFFGGNAPRPLQPLGLERVESYTPET